MIAVPSIYQQVEIFVDGEWIPATFHPCGYSWSGHRDDDEVWWNDFFLTPSGETYPKDKHDHYAELPQWRAIARP